MLLGPILHPDLLAALARAGHSSQILIADGNYPVRTTLGPNAALVHLNLAPGHIAALPVLDALTQSIPIERAQTMDWARSGPFALPAEPPIWAPFRERLSVPLEALPRDEFYAAATSPDVAVVIATAETAVYANLLLTVGVRSDEFAG